MRRLTPYLAIATLITLLIYSLDTYRANNPIKIVDKGYYIPSKSTID